MSDVECRKCGEPWETYGLADTLGGQHEKQRLLRGEGCPCCHWGGACPSCDGTGREEEFPLMCQLCRDSGKVLAWSPDRDVGNLEKDTYYTGYAPAVLRIGALPQETTVLGVRQLPELIGTHERKDANVTEYWMCCPNGCAQSKNFNSCQECDGRGTLCREESEQNVAAAFEDSEDWNYDGIF